MSLHALNRFSTCKCIGGIPIAERLGLGRQYTFKEYLSNGEHDGYVSTDSMYEEAMKAIFEENKPCHRCGIVFDLKVVLALGWLLCMVYVTLC